VITETYTARDEERVAMVRERQQNFWTKPECPLPSTNPIFANPECPLESVEPPTSEPVYEAGMLLKTREPLSAEPTFIAGMLLKIVLPVFRLRPDFDN
jgi:hypothetical protein